MASELDTLELNLTLGVIKGVRRVSIYGDAYNSFEAIPYARPPLGKLRFLAPQPVGPWQGVRDCTHYASRAIQRNMQTGIVSGSEDCLYLNVYTQTLTSDKPLPVMVWIHGGGFIQGEGTPVLYGPDYFMSKPVVLVTFNYRLCSLGFLKLKDPGLSVPGNAGLKDQVMAIRWVRDHIAAFNGDPHNITVFGESAGGASVHYLMISPQTKGLFQKAIPQSGVVLNEWANLSMIDAPLRLARFHGYTGPNVDAEVLKYLRSLPAEKLVDHALVTDEERRNGGVFSFGPTVEAYVGEDCIVPTNPLKMVRNSWSNEIPIMIGGTSFEGLFMYFSLKMFPQRMNSFKRDPERILPQEIRESNSLEQNTELSTRLIQLHFGTRQPSDECRDQFLDLYSFKMFWHGIYRTVLARINYATTNTFLYRFDFDSPDFNLYRTKFCGQDPVRGVAHADDLSYLFFSDDAWKVAPESLERKTIQRMVSMWTSFALNSDPNCELIKPLQWQAVTKEHPFLALNISEQLELEDLPEREKLEVWNSVYNEGTLF